MITIDDFIGLIARLRDPKTGCPWDIKQNFQSMLPHLLEETYEVAEAIHTENKTALREELGDLLLQVIFLSQLANEAGDFTFYDVLNDVHQKIISRHPHVFGDKQAKTSEEALQQWEASKANESAKKAQNSILDDLPFALPALTRAEKLQKRCAKVGFDWDNPMDVFDKVNEELQEVHHELKQPSIDSTKLEEELGDLLFATVNLCRHYQFNAEHTLRIANVKFENRFRKIEQYLATQQKKPQNCSNQELNLLWNKIKSVE